MALYNPSKFTDLQEAVTSIFDILVLFLPIIATLYLAISGYRYIVAQGNPDLVEKAKHSLTYAVVGVAVAYTAVLIIALVAHRLGFNTGFRL